ncbi:hypothetical protein D3C72_1740400 [compost metagenome]
MEVGGDQHGTVAVDLQQGMVRRADVAEVACVEDHLDAPVLRSQAAQFGVAAIGGTVVDEHMFVVVIKA